LIEENVSNATKSKILFDGNCIVCDLEIMHYKRIAPDLFECVDISSADFDAKAYGVTKSAVDQDMHVIIPGGRLVIGVDAFQHIWMRLGQSRPIFRLMSQAIRLPILYPSAKVLYRSFTKIRPLLPKKNR
jgi:predicted DCC family thiol-disulfide oxidoreductase YuxK